MIKILSNDSFNVIVATVIGTLSIFANGNDPPVLYPTDPILPTYYETYDFYDYIGDRPGLQLDNAWPITTGSTNVTVAIVGSGIYPFVELEGRLVAGYNTITENEDTVSLTGEDDGLAALLGANANNGKFAAGIDWNCRIMPIVVKDAARRLNTTNYSRGIDYALSHGCKIILCAAFCGTNYPGDVLISAVSNAIAHGSIVVAGANVYDNWSTNMEYPGAIHGVITARDASYYDPFPGKTLDVSAAYPRLYNITTASARYPSGIYTNIVPDGIPMPASAAMVAGVCSLLVSVRPDLMAAQTRTLISLGAVQPRFTKAKDFDPVTGWGFLNAYNSLILAKTRIEQFQMNKGVAECSWVSPVNASNREPYTVEFSSSVTGGWVAPDVAEYTYTTNRTFFKGTSQAFTNENLFCRLRLRDVLEP